MFEGTGVYQDARNNADITASSLIRAMGWYGPQEATEVYNERIGKQPAKEASVEARRNMEWGKTHEPDARATFIQRLMLERKPYIKNICDAVHIRETGGRTITIDGGDETVFCSTDGVGYSRGGRPLVWTVPGGSGAQGYPAAPILLADPGRDASRWGAARLRCRLGDRAHNSVRSAEG